MEWKMGEIKQVNGEWYQCVEGNCAYCSIQDEACEQRIINDVCRLNRIFKKLEKVGEQFLYKGKQMQSYIRATDELICNWNNNLLLLEHGDSDIIDIEIKQTKRRYGSKETMW